MFAGVISSAAWLMPNCSKPNDPSKLPSFASKPYVIRPKTSGVTWACCSQSLWGYSTLVRSALSGKVLNKPLQLPDRVPLRQKEYVRTRLSRYPLVPSLQGQLHESSHLSTEALTLPKSEMVPGCRMSSPAQPHPSLCSERFSAVLRAPAPCLETLVCCEVLAQRL